MEVGGSPYDPLSFDTQLVRERTGDYPGGRVPHVPYAGGAALMTRIREQANERDRERAREARLRKEIRREMRAIYGDAPPRPTRTKPLKEPPAHSPVKPLKEPSAHSSSNNTDDWGIWGSRDFMILVIFILVVFIIIQYYNTQSLASMVTQLNGQLSEVLRGVPLARGNPVVAAASAPAPPVPTAAVPVSAPAPPAPPAQTSSPA